MRPAITEAVRESAALHVAVLSISFSGGEHAFTRAEVAAMHAALEQARDQYVTVLGSSGDEGAIRWTRKLTLQRWTQAVGQS